MQCDRYGRIQPHVRPTPRADDKYVRSPRQLSLPLQLTIDMSTLTSKPRRGPART